MQSEWMNAFYGGVLIGLAVTLMLLFNGRVTGISGIINGARLSFKSENLWRLFFILGLFLGGLVLKLMNPDFFKIENNEVSFSKLIVAGLFVGFGTVMGSGCTSGHGVCGISRFSLRSITATIVFIMAGVACVYLFRKMGVL